VPSPAAEPPLLALLPELRTRAATAAAVGADTFALPEAAPVAALAARLHAGTVLAQEAAAWLAAGAGYHQVVRLAARAALQGPAAGEAVYVPKASGELEPMLALWPDALVFPTTASLTAAALIELRAFPVHPLGVTAAVAWADGRWCSPAEYFFHDLDHARYKLRADLRLEGWELPDPYQDGTTVDAQGRHRLVFPAVRGRRIGPVLWERAPARLALARRLLHRARALPAPLAHAAELLLFEILHEKSHPLEPAALGRELAEASHREKIALKYGRGFYGADAPAPETIAALADAGRALQAAL
jgi:hypothetical protein